MHLKRWLTSIVAVPLLILIVVWGGAALFSLAIGIVILVSLWEFFTIVSVSGRETALWLQSPMSWFLFVSGAAIALASHMGRPGSIVAVITINFILTGMLSLPRYGADAAVVDKLHQQSLGILYIPVMLAHLVFLRHQPDGVVWILFLLCLVFSGDVGAFYAGSYLGRHKLCPSVSPNKTWEGSAGGIAANLVVCAAFSHLVFKQHPWALMVVFSILVGIAGQVGDLFESQLKRKAGIKDSGIIFPGHGGMLDRIDALLFAAPAAHYLKTLFFS